MNSNFTLEDLILKYQQGIISATEMNQLLSMLDKKDIPEDLQRLFQYYWENPSEEILRNFHKDNFEMVLQKIGLQGPVAEKKISSAKKAFRLYPILKYAAIVIFTFGLTWMLFKHSGTKNKLPQNDVSIVVPFGSKSQISLPDGSRVTLNSGSSLRYHLSENDGLRNVILKGEAYFEIFKDEKHPFIVCANQINIRVIGTRFNVKAYEKENKIETTLLEGSVGIYNSKTINNQKITILKPNQQATFYPVTGNLTVKEVRANHMVVWKDGKFFFENESFESIARSLERNYNIKIVIASKKLREQQFFGIFTQKRTIYQLLDIMRIGSDFTYTTRNDTIYIHQN